MARPSSLDKYWLNIFTENNAANPGWVMLLLFPEGLPDAAAESLQHVLLSLVGNEGICPYRKLVHFVPAVSIEEVRKRLASFTKEIDAFSLEPELTEVAPAAEELLQRLASEPERSIVIVHRLELFQGASAGHKLGAIRTWSGTEVSIESLEERHGSQVGKVVARLLEIAKQRKLLIVANANLASHAADAFEPEVANAPQLCIRGSQRLQDRYGALISRLIRRVRAGSMSLESAMSRARRTMSEPELRAQGEAQLLFANGRFDEAWRTLEPHLSAYDDPSAATCFGVARLGLAAFHHEAARRWLLRGIEVGAKSFSDLQSCWLLARELDEEALSESLFRKLSANYPNEPVVLQQQTMCLLRDWRYEEAAKFARRGGWHFQAAVFESLARPEFDLEATLRLARHDEDRAFICWRAALDAEHRKNLDLRRPLPHSCRRGRSTTATQLHYGCESLDRDYSIKSEWMIQTSASLCRL